MAAIQFRTFSIFGILTLVFVSSNSVSAVCDLPGPGNITCLSQLCVPTTSPLPGLACPALCILDGYATGTCSQDTSGTTMILTCACAGNSPLYPVVQPQFNTPVLKNACDLLCPTVCKSCGFGTGYCDNADGHGIHCNCPNCS